MLPPSSLDYTPLMKLMFVLNLIIDRSALETLISKVSVLRIYVYIYIYSSSRDQAEQTENQDFSPHFLKILIFVSKLLGNNISTNHISITLISLDVLNRL